MYRSHRWREAIQAAPDAKAVHQVIREYVAVLPLAVISALPRECRDALADSDIQSAAITLLHCELRYHAEPAVAGLLHEIAHTYAAASLRIARLSREPVTPPGE